MSKARSTGNIGNIVKASVTGVTISDGTNDLLSISSDGNLSVVGNINASTLDGIDGASFLQTGSFNSFSSSIDTTIKNKLNTDGVISGSAQIDITTSTGYSTFSGSIATTTNNLSGRITTVEGNYATTGSNTFIGSQTITGSICTNGNIVTTGQIVAQTINVQQVTSSIVYSCGSNVFGTDINNTQQFTGSVRVTGSLTVNGTSTVVGSATFSSSVTMGGDLVLTPNDSAISFSSGAARFFTGGAERVRITSTGISCFACQVCVPNVVSTGGVTSLQTNISADGAGVVLQGYVDNNLRIAVRGSGYNDGSRGGLIASTGDFGSNVIAAGSVYVGGTQCTAMSSIYGSSNYIYYNQSTASGIQAANTNTVTNGSIVITNIGGTGAYSIIGNAGLASGYGLYIQSQDRTAASYYPLLLQPNGGKVGIGEITPDNTYQGLTIKGSDPSLRLKTTSGSGWVWIEYVNSSGTNNFSMGVNQTSPYFGIKAGAGMDAPHFAINTCGNVGIGTIIPTQKLEVKGNIRLDSRSKVDSGEIDNITFTKDRPDASTGTYEMGAIRSFTYGGYAGGLTFYSGRHTGNGNYGLISVMTIGSTSDIGAPNLGIGTTSPRTRLQVTPTSNAEVPVLGCASGVATFTSTNTNYGLQFNSTSDGSFHIQSQRFDNIATAYSLVLQPAGGTVAINGNSSQAALHIGESDTRKISYIGNYSIRTTTLFKTFNQGSTTDYWARISLNNSYADQTQGVYGVITVAWHPVHASMGRFNQYRIFQSPYTANNSYMKIQTVFEEIFGWDYYGFSSDVTFYNYQSYLYMKITGTHVNYNWARSIRAELTGGSFAMDNVNLEVGVSAPAGLSGIITKNGSAVLSG